MKTGDIIIAIHFEPMRLSRSTNRYRILNEEKSFLPSHNALFIVHFAHNIVIYT